jgi:hypothetical protein
MNKLFKIFLVLISSSSFAQQWADVGANLGIGFYSGDINDEKLFYNPRLSKSVIYKLNINDRYSAKLSVTNSKIEGADTDFNNPYQNNRQNTFQTGVWDVVLQTEFNFLSYNPLEVGKKPISPYVSLGFGAIYISSIGKPVLAVPFGIGLKYKLYGRVGIGCEWTFRKTFNDEMDGTVDLTALNKHSLIHNNDWLSFINLVATYNITKIRIECPAYE